MNARSKFDTRLLNGLFFTLLGCTFYTIWKSIPWPLIHDIPPLHFMAWQMAEGATPYVDIFDMNMPGTYLIHRFVRWAFGPGDGGWRAFDLLVLVGLALGLWAYLLSTDFIQEAIRNKVALAGALIAMVFHVGNGPIFAGQRDYLMGALVLWAAHLLLKSLEHKKARGSLWLSGILAGSALMIKPPAVVVFPLFILFLLVHTGRKDRLRKMVVFSLGGALVPLLLLVWLLALGAVEAFWESLTGYVIPLYSQLEGQHISSYLIAHQTLLRILLLVGALVWIVGSKRLAIPLRFSMGVLGGIYGIFHYVLQAKGWPYHLYPFLIFCTVV